MTSEPMTAKERAKAGRAKRSEVPRSRHAAWDPPAGRPDPVAVLERQAQTRVPELVPIRYQRMLTSPFAFYRGAAAIMASDLAATPATGLRVQACGDAHLSNFGVFAAPDRDLVFDVDDFDETLPGPWEWDVKRLAASFAIAGRERGFDERTRRSVVRVAVREYRAAMRRFAGMRNLDVWYARLDANGIRHRLESEAPKRETKRFKHDVVKARAKDSLRAFAKLTCRVDGELRIISDPPLIVPVEEVFEGVAADRMHEQLRAVLDEYAGSLADDCRLLRGGYRYVHAARKVVGVGSVGTRAWIALMLGRDDDDPLFVQVKEAGESVLEPFIAPSEYGHHGRRVVEGQRMMQAASDALLGWCSATGPDGVERHYYVRQLWDGKGSADVEGMKPAGMTEYAKICGSTLGRAHARSGDRIGIAGYLGGGSTFDFAVTEFAEAYADQNERDFAALGAAADEGRIVVEGRKTRQATR